MKVSAEIVNGECPTCNEITMLVGLTPELFRCMNCGSDLQQHVNGKITYLPVMTSRTDGGTHFVKDWKDQWPSKNLHILHLETNLKKEALGNIKNRSQRERKDKKD